MIRKLPHRDDPPYEIPEDKRVCSCGGKLREIGERHFANAVKALSKKHDRVTELTVSGEALRLIGEILIKAGREQALKNVFTRDR